MNISIIGNDCTGCGGCIVCCPKQCINMCRDDNGFMRPQIDETLCIGCGICVKHCPVTNQSKLFLDYRKNKYYSAISGNTELLNKSSSGGLFALFAKSVIENGGYVCGCVYDVELRTAKHIVVSKMEDAVRMCGSKYVQSNAYDCFPLVRDLLTNNKEVLFTGTACQIASLKLYLGKEYSNLFSVDILCHGSPSSGLFSDYVRFLEDKVKSSIIDIQFRDKSKNGWGSEHRTSVTYIDRNGNLKKKFLILPAYFSAFFYGLSLRECCYECKFAKTSRVSDITIGDFWGAWKKYQKPFYEGISVASVNSEVGNILLNRIKSELSFVEELCVDEAIYSNDNFDHPVKCPKERDKFFEFYRKNGYKGIWKVVYFTSTYRKKTLISFYGALIPKKLQKIIRLFRRGGLPLCL